MDEFNSEMSRPRNMYTSSEPSPSQTQVVNRGGGPWKSFGTSMNAISFGFLATAILMCLFLIIAIFEHLFKTSHSFSSSDNQTDRNLESGTKHKLGSSQIVSTSHTVLMPGQQYPTFIAQPSPLPCQRERVNWPSHEHSFSCDTVIRH